MEHLSDAVIFPQDNIVFKHSIYLDQNSVWKEICSTWSCVADKLVVKALLCISRDKSNCCYGKETLLDILIERMYCK